MNVIFKNITTQIVYQMNTVLFNISKLPLVIEDIIFDYFDYYKNIHNIKMTFLCEEIDRLRYGIMYLK